MFKSVRFENFKALEDYTVHLRRVNVLVGPNNAGKSTILDGFRALEGALRSARRTLPRTVLGSRRQRVSGYEIPISSLGISTENIHSDYRKVETLATFTIENGNKLLLLFKEEGSCVLYFEEKDSQTFRTKDFAVNFPIDISTVPTLGPFEEEETYLTDQYIAQWSKSRRAHRMFRNIWHRQSKAEFARFRKIVEDTWPGMSIQPPEVLDYRGHRLAMFCKEGRIDREIYWAGFGFQVWLQFLTHLLRAKPSSTVVMEPFEVLREIVRDGYCKSVGGPIQLIKIYEHANAVPVGIYWPDKKSGTVCILGRPLMSYETTRWGVIDPDEPDRAYAYSASDEVEVGEQNE